MKKRIALLISFFLLAAGCSAAPGPAAQGQETGDLDTFMATQALELTMGMDEMASSEEYMQLMSSSQTITDKAGEIAAQDYGTPQSIAYFDLGDDALFTITGVQTDWDAFSPEIQEKIRSKINAAIIGNNFNAMQGVEVIAATAVLNDSESYLCPEGFEHNTLLVLEYPGGYSSMAAFVRTGEGVISADACFVGNTDEGLTQSVQTLLAQEARRVAEGEELQNMLKG